MQFGIQLDGSRSARSGAIDNSLFIDVHGPGASGTALNLKLGSRARLNGGGFEGNWRDIDTDSPSDSRLYTDLRTGDLRLDFSDGSYWIYSLSSASSSDFLSVSSLSTLRQVCARLQLAHAHQLASRVCDCA